VFSTAKVISEDPLVRQQRRIESNFRSTGFVSRLRNVLPIGVPWFYSATSNNIALYFTCFPIQNHAATDGSQNVVKQTKQELPVSINCPVDSDFENNSLLTYFLRVTSPTTFTRN
jgi:hypothetical protein